MKVYYDHHLCRVEATPYELQELHAWLTDTTKKEVVSALRWSGAHPYCGDPLIWTGLLDQTRDWAAAHNIPFEVEGYVDRSVSFSEIEPPELRGIELRDYQVAAIKQAIHRGHGILQMGTGAGKTEIFVAILKWYLDHGKIENGLIVVGTERLLEQTKLRLIERGVPDEMVGVLGNGRQALKQPITVAISNGLYNGVKSRRSSFLEALSAKQAVIFDECHHLRSESWSAIAAEIPAPYRFGASATPFNNPLADAVDDRIVVGATGEVVYSLPAWVLVQEGLLAEPEVRTVAIHSTETPDGVDGKLSHLIRDWADVYRYGIVANPHRNAEIVHLTQHYANQGCSVLVFVHHKRHGHDLLRRCAEDGYGEASIFTTGKKEVWTAPYGTVKKEKWDLERLHEFISQPSITFATPVLDEGVDISGINAIIYAAAGRSPRQLLQRLGRGMRVKEGSVLGNRCHVIDFMDLTHPYLKHQSLTRFSIYRNHRIPVAAL